MATRNKVEFKGTKNGIVLYLDMDSEFALLMDGIKKWLSRSKDFFKGATIVDINGKILNEDQLEELEELLLTEYDIKMDLKEKICEEEQGVFEGLEEGMTKFVKQTLRSGMEIEFNGNVVVLGDVNPGAVIIASGNIIVMGSLRGIAHAGADGNRDAYILANSLRSNQLRIETLIARAPDNAIFRPKYSEIAYIDGGSINIEPYNVKSKKKRLMSLR